MKLKKIILLVSLPILGVLISFIFLEFSLRLFQYFGEKHLFNITPSRTTLIWQDHSVLGKVMLHPNTSGWFVTPSHEYYTYIQTNSAGFYDSEHKVKKPENVFRILFLGDSFVASLQTPLEKTYFKQLENNLNNLKLDKKVEVISIGLGDTGPSQQYLALRNIGLQYNPDLVIQMFLTANDFKNDSFNLQKDPFRPYFTLNNQGDLIQAPHQNKSEKKYSSIREWFKNFRIIETLLSFRQKIQESLINKNSDYPLDYHVYDTKYNPDFTQSLKVTKQILKETRKVSTESGAKYLLVTLANNEQVNKKVWEELKQTYPKLKTADLNLKKPDKLIADFCKEESINYLQMLPMFLQYSDDHPNTLTHFKIDGHFNQTGTDLAYQILSKYFIEHKEDYFSIK